MVYSADQQRGLRIPHGRRIGSIPKTLRSKTACDMYGRVE